MKIIINKIEIDWTTNSNISYHKNYREKTILMPNGKEKFPVTKYNK